MSELGISSSRWAELSEAQKIESVRTGRVTLRELVEGLLDGSAQLQKACTQFLKNCDVWLLAAPLPAKEHASPAGGITDESQAISLENSRKRRQGLPQGYVPRVHRHESI